MSRRLLWGWGRLAVLAGLVVGFAACHESQESRPPGLTIQAKGGSGANGDGGSGGEIKITNGSGNDVKIMRSGAVNAAIAMPTILPFLGPNPRTISGSVILQPNENDEILGDDGLNPATGLDVLPGATLTLLPNLDKLGDEYRDTIRLDNLWGVRIQGIVQISRRETLTGYDSDDACQLRLYALNIYVDPSGQILGAGGADGADAGGNGGVGADVELNADMSIVFYGSIDTSGGAGGTDGNGGNGGDVGLYSDSGGVFSSGSITANGGIAQDGIGGNGGRIDLDSDSGSEGPGFGVFNMGPLTAIGGNGSRGGGNGGEVNIDCSSAGAFTNTAIITLSGGNATVEGPGGHGGELNIDMAQGTYRIAGSFISRGGAGINDNGGNGGDIDISHSMADSSNFACSIGMAIDICGGNGAVTGASLRANGGDAGDINIDVEDSERTPRPGTVGFYLVGYDLFDLSGGDGSRNGGAGGGLEVENNPSIVGPIGSDNDIIGGAYNDVTIVARGGNGASAEGGSGGWLEMYTSSGTGGRTIPDFDRSVINNGSLDLRGGNGETVGGNGGNVSLFEKYRCENNGNIDCSAGNGRTAKGGEGEFGFEIESYDVVRNTGSLTANGGASAEGYGGAAGMILIFGRSATTSGPLSANGGAGGAGSGIVGGNGGYIQITSAEAPSTVSGAMTVNGGAANSDGMHGFIIIDGIVMEGPNTVVAVIATDPNAYENPVDVGVFTITRLGPTTDPLTVYFDLDGTATLTSDYTVSASSPITIPAGSSSVTVTVTPVADLVTPEPRETVILHLREGVNYFVHEDVGDSATVNIDELPCVTLIATDPYAAETGPNTGTLTITRSGPTTAALVVNVTLGGSATLTTDYTTSPDVSGGTVTIPAGASSVVVTVTPIDDAVAEGYETVMLSILPSVGVYTLGVPSSDTVVIEDNDVVVTVIATDDLAGENGNPGEFTIYRTGATTAALIVNVTTVAGSATIGVGNDYTTSPDVSGGTVTIPAGVSSVVVTVTPLADTNGTEGSESAVLSIAPPVATEYIIGSPGSATVSIEDGVVVRISAPDNQAREGTDDTGIIRVERTGPVTAALTVNVTVAVTGGTDPQLTDCALTPAVTSTVTIPAGASETYILVAALNDPDTTDETLTITVIAGTGYAVGSSSIASVTLDDE